MTDCFEAQVKRLNRVTDRQLKPMTDGKRTYTVDEVQGILGISRSTAYGFLRNPPFRTIRVNRQIRIIKSSFDKWLENSTEVKHG